jgi:uncharacterized protein
MPVATFRFYAELNDFLPPAKRQVDFEFSFESSVSIKHVIESLGVPHPEVDLILVEGKSHAAGSVSVDFSYILQEGDHVSVYPVFESMDISPLLRLRPEPLRQTRFILDAHLGRLAVYLRLLGFDALYRNDFGDEELAELSSSQNRLLLTRDRGLLKRSLVTRGYFVRSDQPRTQVMEILRRFDLGGAIEPFKRCLRCNGKLERVEKEDVITQLQPSTRSYYKEFYRCQDCGHIYWKGSHYQRMQAMIEEMKKKDK